jgi:hypothetical protein
MLDTVQNDVVLDATANTEKIRAFIKECFPGMRFSEGESSTENGLNCIIFHAKYFPSDVSFVLSSIEGINVLYDEVCAWSALESNFVGTHGEFLLDVTYDNYVDDDEYPDVTLTVYVGNSSVITTTAHKLARELLTSKLNNDAQALLSLVLRNKDYVTSDTMDEVLSNLNLEFKESGYDEMSHELSLVYMLGNTFKQANRLNQIKMVEQVAPNIKQVTFKVTHNTDMSGMHFQDIESYCVHLLDGTEVSIGYGENWLEDLNSKLVENNDDIFPDTLKDHVQLTDIDDEETMEALTLHLATLFGSSDSKAFWFITNQLDSLVWDTASKHHNRVVIAGDISQT